MTNKGNEDGMIIKYNARGEVEWAEGIGGTNNDKIMSVAETSDGGYIVGGYFKSRSIDLGNGISLTNKGNEDGMVIKYNATGEVEWAEEIVGINVDVINSVAATSDGGYIVGGYFRSSNIDLGNGISLVNKGSDDGMVIKLEKTELPNPTVIRAQGIGETNDDYIESVAGTSDGGYIVGGCFKSSSIDLGNEISLTNKGNDDGMVIKYSQDWEVEWAKGIGGTSSDYINSVAECSDGGYIVGGYFESSSIDLGNGISLTSHNVGGGFTDGMVIKYSQDGEVEWAKGIGGTYEDRITSVAECNDGGYIVGGFFYSNSIDLGNGISLTNKESYDGMAIKYSKDGEVEWAKGIGGTSDEYIATVSETSDGGYIVGGYFASSRIDLGNGISLTKKGSCDGMVIKYSQDGEAEWAQGIGGTDNEYINSVAECNDGGYIVGGYFYSNNINLENGVSLTNKSSSTSYSDGMVIKYSQDGEVEWA